MADEPFVLEIPWRAPAEAFTAFAEQPYALLLDGAGTHKESSWSYIAAAPMQVVEYWPDQPGDPLAAARAALSGIGARKPLASLPPFSGGLAGLLSYELGARLDRLPRAPRQTDAAAWPDLSLGLYDCVAAFDRSGQRAMVIAWDWDGQNPRTKANAFAEQLSAPAPAFSASAWPRPKACWRPDQYAARIDATIGYIHAGDCFQANLSQLFSGALPTGASPFELYQRLAARSRAPFSGFWRGPDRALISNSPERLARLCASEQGRIVTAKPIKGTRPRGASPEHDASLAADLRQSAKDRAENLMIVDLLRNDLSRVCSPGSVKVPELFTLESFANVHHLVSTITGALRPDRDAFDLIRAIFPGGSITGAPKIRAAEIIAELEGVARGPYCGSLVWFGPDGAMDASILIRTIACDFTDNRWRANLRSGGGIVADSTPEQEVQESQDKAAAMLAAFGP